MIGVLEEAVKERQAEAGAARQRTQSSLTRPGPAQADGPRSVTKPHPHAARSHHFDPPPPQEAAAGGAGRSRLASAAKVAERLAFNRAAARLDRRRLAHALARLRRDRLTLRRLSAS